MSGVLILHPINKEIQAALSSQTYRQDEVCIYQYEVHALFFLIVSSLRSSLLSLHCLLCLLHYNVVSLCRGLVTTELVSL